MVQDFCSTYEKPTKPTLIIYLTCKNVPLELSITFPESRALNQF